MAKDTEKKEEKKEEKPKAGPAKGSLKIAIRWNGEYIAAGKPAPEGLVDWIKSNFKKSGRPVSDYIVE